MNLLKKSGAALAAALLLIGAQPAFAAPSLSEEEILMANRYMKRCSTSLFIEKCKLKLQ